MEGELTDHAVQRYEQEQPNAIAVRTMDDIKRLSLIFVESGMFKADKNATSAQKMYQAGVKIIAGVEFGIQPFAAMRGINIINGNAEMSANLMAAKVKGHPKYDYRVEKWDHDGCTLVFYEVPHPASKFDDWYRLGESSFTKDDAVRARLNGDNWQKFARNMYFARAMSNGVRIHCPDVFYGAPVYSEGEISGEFEATPQQTGSTPESPADSPVEAIEDEKEGAMEPMDELTTEPTRPALTSYLTQPQRKRIIALLGDLGINDKPTRVEILSNILEREIESTNQLSKQDANTVIDELTLLVQDQQEKEAS